MMDRAFELLRAGKRDRHDHWFTVEALTLAATRTDCENLWIGHRFVDYSPTHLANIAGCVYSLRVDGDILVANCRLLDTPQGRACQDVLRVKPDALALAAMISIEPPDQHECTDSSYSPDPIRVIHQFELRSCALVPAHEKIQ